MVSSLRGSLTSQLVVLPQERGELEVLEVVFEQHRGLVGHDRLPDRRFMLSLVDVVATLAFGR